MAQEIKILKTKFNKEFNIIFIHLFGYLILKGLKIMFIKII